MSVTSEPKLLQCAQNIREMLSSKFRKEPMFTVSDDIIDEMIAEHVRNYTAALRGSLERIVAIENKEWGGDWEEIDEARLIARNALK